MGNSYVQKWFLLKKQKKEEKQEKSPGAENRVVATEVSGWEFLLSSQNFKPVLYANSIQEIMYMYNDLCSVDYWCAGEESLHTCLRNRCKVLWLHHPACRTSFLFMCFDLVSFVQFAGIPFLFLVLNFYFCYLLCALKYVFNETTRMLQISSPHISSNCRSLCFCCYHCSNAYIWNESPRIECDCCSKWRNI